MTPSIGHIVIVKGVWANGSDEHPAIVNHVFGTSHADGSWLINTTVFPDCGEPKHETSIRLFETREACEEFFRSGHGTVAAFWPPRV